MNVKAYWRELFGCIATVTRCLLRPQEVPNGTVGNRQNTRIVAQPNKGRQSCLRCARSGLRRGLGDPIGENVDDLTHEPLRRLLAPAGAPPHGRAYHCSSNHGGGASAESRR